jgi:hypothetical protein
LIFSKAAKVEKNIVTDNLSAPQPRAKSLKFVLQVMDYPFVEIKTSFLPPFINLTTLVAI